MTGVLIRILLVAVAAVVAAYGIASAQSVDRCDDAVRTALAWKAKPADAQRIADETLKECTDSRQRTAVASALIRLKEVPVAQAMALQMTKDQPEDYRGWVLREIIAGLNDRAAVPALYAKAQALNARGIPPLPAWIKKQPTP